MDGQAAATNVGVVLGCGLGLALGFEQVLSSLALVGGVGTTTGPASLPRITPALGVGAVVVASLSLYFAAWLGVGLGLPDAAAGAPAVRAATPDAGVAAALGAAIWGLFVATAGWRRHTITGAVLTAAGTRLRGLCAGASALAGPPSVTRAGGEDPLARIEAYVAGLEGSRLSPRRLRDEIARYLTPAEIAHVRAEPAAYLHEADLFGRLRSRGMGERGARLVARRVRAAFTLTRPDEGGARVGAAPGGAEASATEDDELRRRWEQHLRHTGREGLAPEALRREFVRILRHPGRIRLAVQRRSRLIDHDAVVAVLEQRPDLDRAEAERVADELESALAAIRDQLEAITGRDAATRTEIQAKLAWFLGTLEDPEATLDDVGQEARRMFGELALTGALDAAALRAIDDATLRRLVAALGDDEPDDAEALVQRLAAARDVVAAQLEGRAPPLDLAGVPHDSQAAVWACLTVVISGGAAALGGITGVLP